MAADGGNAPLVKRKPEASGADNLLRYFNIEQFCKPDALAARDYNRDAPGDRSLYRGDGAWSLAALADWPPVSTYHYEPLSVDTVKAALRLQPGPTSLPQAYLGELVVSAPPVVSIEDRSKKTKKDKKEKKEKKEKKAKKEKKSKEEKKRKRDDTGPEHSSQWTQNTAGTSVS